MADKDPPDKNKDQSGDNSEETFDYLLQKKLEVEERLKEKFTRVMTLMQSDIRGSTEFQQVRGDIEAAAILSIHKKLLNPILSKKGGKVISEATDGAFVAFEGSTEKAVEAAIEFMHEVHKYNQENHTKLNIRIAMNRGPVIVKEENQLTGLTVSSTARVEQSMKMFEKKREDIAKNGLIFISGSVYDEIRNSDNIICRWTDRVEAKGLDKPLDLYRVVWNLEQEQIIHESVISSKVTKGDRESQHRVDAPKKRSIFIVDITKEAEWIKVSGYENTEKGYKTVRHFDKVKVDNDKIEKYIQKIITLLNQGIHSGSIDKEVLNNLKSAGQVLFDELFTEAIKSKLAATTSEDLIMNIDDQLVHIPWELVYDGNFFLCLRFNMGRVVSTRQAISESSFRPMSRPLRMLVLSDPRDNLKNASKEGYNIQSKLELISSPINVNVKAGDIKSSYVVEKIHNFDIIHYAGHSDYDSENPARSGWLLNDKKLDAGEIREISRSQPMPALVFSNACQSGQTDKWKLSDDYENKIYGMANAFLLAGVNHYVGTFWEILDEPSSNFAMSFYEHMSNGKSIGKAVRLARKQLIKKYGEDSIIWASYMLYGDPSFCYINPLVQEEAIPAKTAEKEQLVYAPANGGFRGEKAMGRPFNFNVMYWLGGIAALILIVLAVFFFNSQMKHTKLLVKKDKEKRIDTLVTKLAGRYRDGTIADVNTEPIDDWVSRPLVVSLFPLKINGQNSETYQNVILSNIAEHFGASDRLQLVDRDLIVKLLEELNLSSSDLADKQTALRIGKLVGARFIASGSVFSIGEEINVSMKLIETETTSIVKTRSQSCMGPDSLSILTEAISVELLAALINKFPLQARIIGFADDSVVINIGKNHGMVKGTKLDVYREQNIEGSNATIKNKVGTIEVKDVEKNVSTGAVLSKTMEFGKNMKLRESL